MSNQFTITKQIIEANLKQLHNITPTEKLVLVCLSSYLGSPKKDGVYSCFPSQGRLSREAGCVRSTVNSALQKFEELGFIRSLYQVNDSGANTSKLYTWLGIPQTEEQEESEDSAESSQSEVVEIRTEDSEPAPEILVNVESSPLIQPEVSQEPVPTSSWWDDFEAELAEESPF
ncbi:Helix-turn-helix domain-containing protein [Vibrio crassostreae]|nr:Helix-turn-helix domain-containing protein [Vibrio crassostreae]CAK2358458.1 Helix-turn-helix domain-containing protein [Vibrio crassostreae]CAK2436294.1 Helix-turn-helix domain-containing protein [Vibrio crassostreae]CAK3040916.1 Helix-turn-helix domain-containing protein [Vibrio crassostreae]